MNLLKNKDLIFDSLNLVNKCINAKETDAGELAFDTLKLLGKSIKSSQEQTTKTMFYNDNNFFEKMKNSKYTKFINKLKTLNIPIDEYKLPIIVNIGNESSGKSSLIRNILKCDIFPIDKNLCTKCPIKIELFNSDIEEYIITFKDNTIKLTDKEKTKLHVSAIMNKIDYIIDHELYIKISNQYVINSTFYDLPGIIEYPADMRDKSKNIINKYINQPNTLIICVIPANTTRLTANQALGMVNDANKTKDCLIALTMVDLLHNDDIELFVDRILMKNNEIKKLNIKKVIGVISHKNKDINENVWFENNLLNNIDDNSLKEEINKNITLENLLITVDEMFNDFINTNWKNDAINKTNNQIIKLENELNELGKDITLKELLEFIKTNSNFNILLQPRLAFIFDGSSNSIPDYNYDYNYYNYLKYNQDMEHITNKYEEYKNNIINKIIININNLFEINNEYKLARFEKLQNYLINEYTQIIKNHFKHIDIWFKSYLQKFKYEYNCDELRKFQNYIMDNFYRYIHTDLYTNDNPLNINDKLLSELLIEKDEYKLKRSTLNNSIKTYKKHKSFFENL
jgi:hypothetical protein